MTAEFVALCGRHGIEPTARQWRKYQTETGRAWDAIKSERAAAIATLRALENRSRRVAESLRKVLR